MSKSVLIVDDEADIRNLLADIFLDEGYDVHKAAHSEQALSIIKSQNIDLIVLDIWLENSDMDGIEILKYLKKSNHKDIPILMISGHGNVEMAVGAMKIGAFDFIEKPFKIDYILMTAARAIEQTSLRIENRTLKNDTSAVGIVHRFKSPAMISLYKSIEKKQESDARVLITGDIGTGKSRIAKLTHEQSGRFRDELVIVNASMLDDTNINHYFSNETATLILEHIELLSTAMQNAILHRISTGKLPRLISTTTKINENFSTSLYDRLAVIHYHVPRLNERVEDIPILTQEFFEKLARDLMIQTPTISQDALNILITYDWTQNIHQLKVAIEWVVLQKLEMQADKAMPIHILPNDLDFLKNKEQNKIVSFAKDIKGSSASRDYLTMTLKQARDEFEKDYLIDTLHHFHGNISKMADHIDMDRTALYRKLKTMNIDYDGIQNNKKVKS